MRDHRSTDESGLAIPGGDVDLATPGYQTRVPVLGWNPVPGAASYDVDVALYESGNCAYGSGSLWRVKTSVPFWTPLGVGPAPEPTTFRT